MGKQQEPKRGDYRSLIRWAIASGWQEARHGKHLILVWPANGRKMPIPGTASDHRSWLNTYKAIQRVMEGK